MSPPGMGEITAVDAEMTREIRQAVKDSHERGLSPASKWLSEILYAVSSQTRQITLDPPGLSSTPPQLTSPSLEPTQILDETATPSKRSPRHPDAPVLSPQNLQSLLLEREWETQDQDELASALVCMEARDYTRVEPLVRQCTSSKAKFLALYSSFIVTEQKERRDGTVIECQRFQPYTPPNPSIPELLVKLANTTDPWLLFLKGLFLSRLFRREEAIEQVLLSISIFPWNWSAWCLLGSLIWDAEELNGIMYLLPLHRTHPLVQFLQIKTMLEMQPTENDLALCDRLLKPQFFPGSLWLMTRRANTLAIVHRSYPAMAQYEKVFTLDPNRLDSVDNYSHLLFLSNQTVKLARLAQTLSVLDKDRPEVCVVIGNHYSHREQREEAIQYFKRATQLDRTYIAAWTLLGHEYMQTKNSHAAVETYRRAVDVDRKDYRAWYGLGQAYELLNNPQYGLHYYHRATSVRPYDERLWKALSDFYKLLERPRESLDCLKRALISADPRASSVVFEIAKVHEQLGEFEEAAAYHRRIVEVCQADLVVIEDYAESLIAVAEYQLTVPDGDLLLAKEYLRIVANSHAEEVAKATNLYKLTLKMIEEREKEKLEEEGDSIDSETTIETARAKNNRSVN